MREKRTHEDGDQPTGVAGGAPGKHPRTARHGRGSGRGGPTTPALTAGPSPLDSVDLDEPYSFHLGQSDVSAGPARTAGLPAGVDYQHVPGTLSFRVAGSVRDGARSP